MTGPSSLIFLPLGADVVGDEALIESFITSNGKSISFDKLICTPDMSKVSLPCKLSLHISDGMCCSSDHFDALIAPSSLTLPRSFPQALTRAGKILGPKVGEIERESL
jgi:hypothetical protein